MQDTVIYFSKKLPLTKISYKLPFLLNATNTMFLLVEYRKIFIIRGNKVPVKLGCVCF